VLLYIVLCSVDMYSYKSRSCSSCVFSVFLAFIIPQVIVIWVSISHCSVLIAI